MIIGNTYYCFIIEWHPMVLVMKLLIISTKFLLNFCSFKWCQGRTFSKNCHRHIPPPKANECDRFVHSIGNILSVEKNSVVFLINQSKNLIIKVEKKYLLQSIFNSQMLVAKVYR